MNNFILFDKGIINNVVLGDNLDVMKTMPNNFVDSIVTDPPAGIGFMGKAWDKDKGGRDAWVEWLTQTMTEALRVLKPGGHALIWALPRTSHWTAWAVENAGFKIRDCVYFVFGTGLPKSQNISKAIDKSKGVDRKVIGVKPGHEGFVNRGNMSSIQGLKGTLGGKGGFARPWMDDPDKVENYHMATASTSPEAQQWDGWGTALKPAVECWWLCRKPLSEKTMAANVLKWGCGGLNIDGCRLPTKETISNHARGEESC